MATIPKRLTIDHQLNLPDEVLIEILLRLPLLSLHLFKSVSKHWFSLITSEYFNRRLREPRIDTPCGLFIHCKSFIRNEYYDFVTLGPKVTSFPLGTIADAGCNFEIMHSCNGLILCSNIVSSRVEYYVYNPFTERFKNIPFALEPQMTNMVLAFDPTKSPYYKVVLTKMNRGLKRPQQIRIYSSETGKWRTCGPSFPRDTFLGLRNGIYWNNAIHWINYHHNSHCKLDIVDHNPMVTKIQTPALENCVNHTYTKLFESRGSMLLLIRDYSPCRCHVFEMRKESSEWLVKYIVDDLDNIVPVRWITSHYEYNPFLCIVLGERGDDSFMVIESDKQIVRYNFVSKTVSTLFNFLSSHDTYKGNMPIPFIASLAGV